jgi:hypothetical protein
MACLLLSMIPFRECIVEEDRCSYEVRTIPPKNRAWRRIRGPPSPARVKMKTPKERLIPITNTITPIMKSLDRFGSGKE